MKITKGKLRQIIREEVSRVLSEQNEKDYAKQIGSADQMDVAQRIALAMSAAVVGPNILKPVNQHICRFCWLTRPLDFTLKFCQI